MERFKIILYPGQDGYLIAEALAIPGCISQGKTEQEALGNIKEAIEGCLESLKAHNQSIPKVELREIDIEI